MRLVDVRTYKVKEFQQREVPPYAILSHTWDKEEITLQDLENDEIQKMASFCKFEGSCKQAERDGFDYIWIDTCCIDKTSSAELSEAINSMFKWYGEADICYVYLQDVKRDDRFEQQPEGFRRFEQQSENFRKSRWFTRGWTLQELIAPSIVIFFADDWSEIGSRSTFAGVIALATGIDRGFFSDGYLSIGGKFDQQKLEKYSIAQKMSWASRRVTSRIEDEAYCLLGLFGVNMPLLYGEGRMAFIRLQEEIMKRSADHTIFAWNPISGDSSNSGFLAYAPALFANSSDIIEVMQDRDLPPHGITNKGIQITLPILDSLSYSSFKSSSAQNNVVHQNFDSDEIQLPLGIRFVVSGEKTYLAFLSCTRSTSYDSVIALSLERDEEGQNEAISHSPFFRRGQLLSIQAEMAKKAERSIVYLQSIYNSSKIGTRLWRKSEEWPLVIVRQTLHNAESGLRLLTSWPSTVTWTIQKSGMMSARFFGEESSFIFFKNDNLEAFCLAVTCNRQITYARIIENVPMDSPDWDLFTWINDTLVSGGILDNKTVWLNAGGPFGSAHSFVSSRRIYLRDKLQPRTVKDDAIQQSEESKEPSLERATKAEDQAKAVRLPFRWESALMSVQITSRPFGALIELELGFE